MTLRKYRIVKKSNFTHQAQCWRIWFPFWVFVGVAHMSKNVALREIEDYKESLTQSRKPVVVYKDYE